MMTIVKGINAQINVLVSYTDFGFREIRVGPIHRLPTRPKIRVGLVLHSSGAYGGTLASAILKIGSALFSNVAMFLK